MSHQTPATQSLFADNVVRLVLLGKTGNGKSSAANTILGEKKCKPARGLGSGTDKCDRQEVCRDGLTIQVTDTPGVCDTHRPPKEIHEEIVKSVASVTPGPHAVLMVFRANARFTREEHDAYRELKKLFGKELVEHMILVFSGLDDLEEDETLKGRLEKAPANFRQVLEEAGSRWIGFNNKADWEKRKQQGDQLIRMVSTLVQANGGKYFSNTLIDEFEKKIQEQMHETGKTHEEVQESVIREEDPTFLGSLLHVVSFGYVPKNACAVM